MRVKQYTLARLNEALDCERDRLGVTTDQAFAQRLKIHPKTLSFLRHGKVAPVTAIVADLLVDQSLATPVEHAALMA